MAVTTKILRTSHHSKSTQGRREHPGLPVRRKKEQLGKTKVDGKTERDQVNIPENLEKFQKRGCLPTLKGLRRAKLGQGSGSKKSMTRDFQHKPSTNSLFVQ